MGIVFTPALDHGKNQHAIGDLMIAIGTLTFSGSYVAGGEVPTVSTGGTGLKSLFKQTGVGEVLAITAAKAVTFHYDNTNDKLQVFAINPAAVTADVAPAELPAAAYDADLSGAQVVIFGR